MRTLSIILLLSIPILSAAQSGRSHRYRDNEKNKKKRDYHHIITATPFSGIVTYGDINPGVGIDYEYVFGKKKIVGVHIPVMFGLNPPDDGFSNSRRTVFFVAPGVRFHADGMRGRVDFSTGPSLLLGSVHYKYDNSYYNPYASPADYNYSINGIAVDNAINIQERGFIFGFDVRTGYTFEKQDGSRYFLQFGMHFGGRFL